MISKTFLQLLLFFSISTSFAQEINQNLEWKALNFYQNEQYDEAIDACHEILTNHSTDVVANRTRFILSRSFMQNAQYHEAFLVLKKTELNAEFFPMGIQGLMGDCQSEQGNYKKARAHYLNAIEHDINTALTPYFLFKAYLCSKELNQPREANKYIQTILDYFPAYSGKYQISKYLTLDPVPSLILTQPEISQPTVLGIGTVNGESVSARSFYEALGIARENARLQAMQTGSVPQEVYEDRVWKSFAEEEALNREYERIKLYTDDEEMMAYLCATDGYSIQPEFRYYTGFSDENGDFDANKLLERINEMKDSQEPEMQEAWANTADYYRKKLRQEKYFNLIGMTHFVTSLEVDSKMAENRTYRASFYCERFRDVPDEDISFSNEELKAYYEQNKSKIEYRIEDDHRKVLFLREEIAPTKADTTLAYSKANELKVAFKKSKDDSLFVITHSGLKFYTSGPYSTAVPTDHRKAQEGKYLTYPISVAGEMESAKIGEIVGPYLFNNNVTIAKVIGRTDDVINARHILLMTKENADGYSLEDAEKIYRLVNNENFEEFVQKYSEDPGSAKKGGQLGDFFFGDMVPPFATYCAEAPVGEIGFVQTQFGYHIVQVTKREGIRLPKLAVVTIPVELSEESYSIPEDRLEEFRTSFLAQSSNSNLTEVADGIAESLGTFVRTSEVMDKAPRTFAFDTQLSEDMFLQFAYDSANSIGSISPVFGDSMSFYLCILGEIHKKGIPNFESVKDRMRSDFIRDRKTELLKKQINAHTDSEKKNRKIEVELSLANTQIPMCGFEPEVIGKAIDAYHSGLGEIIVRGNSGIFCIEVTEDDSNQQNQSKEEMRELIHRRNEEDVRTFVRKVLVEINQVIDNRDLHRLGIRD